jgi:hypothetical protein
MKSNVFRWTACTIAVLFLSLGALAQAQTQLSGLINAYSPQMTGTGPYEVRGPWSLVLKSSGLADFSAALNMELSDGWVLTLNNGNFDPNARGAHTHHVTMSNVAVTWLSNGFRISGPATITLNGNPAPVSPSLLVIDVTGGKDVKLSNITLTFGNPGSKHFGSEPLPGVVQSVK